MFSEKRYLNVTDYLFLNSGPFAQIVIGALGAIWGSFFNVCIQRMPRNETLLFSRSKCPDCHYQIPWHLNIPLVSYFLLRGRCQNCKKPISIQYPVVEGFTALLYIVLFNKFGLTLRFGAYVLFASILLVISVIDLYHQIIPDELSLSGLAAGFVFSFFLQDLSPWQSLAGIFLGGGVFFSIAALYEKMAHREGLGGGDIKLLAMIGAWLGIKSILAVVILSSALGSLVGILVMAFKKKDLKSSIPFGPFLSVGAMLYLLFGPEIHSILFP